jgi:hypothetical protein
MNKYEIHEGIVKALTRIGKDGKRVLKKRTIVGGAALATAPLAFKREKSNQDLATAGYKRGIGLAPSNNESFVMSSIKDEPERASFYEKDVEEGLASKLGKTALAATGVGIGLKAGRAIPKAQGERTRATLNTRSNDMNRVMGGLGDSRPSRDRIFKDQSEIRKHLSNR